MKSVLIFKHFKTLKKQNILPSELQLSNIVPTCGPERVELLNNYFKSVFAPKIEFSVAYIDTNFTEKDSFAVSATTIEKSLSDLDVSNSQGPYGLPPIHYRKLAKVYRKHYPSSPVKLSELSRCCLSSIVSNYRPITLLIIISKILELCIFLALHKYFSNYFLKRQHGFVKNKTVVNNILSFVKKIKFKKLLTKQQILKF